MALLSKEQIKKADKKRFVDVPVKEWGGEVRLQEMSASDRDDWENEALITEVGGPDEAGNTTVTNRYNSKHVRARLLVRCMVDGEGRRLYTSDEVASLGSLAASSVQKLFNAAQKLNGIGAKDIEELEKNSDAAPSGASTSSSASSSV